MKETQIGKFKLRKEWLKDQPYLVREIMGRCIIVRAELMYYDYSVHYEAISAEFDDVPQGSLLPEYEWVIEGLDSGMVPRKVHPDYVKIYPRRTDT